MIRGAKPARARRLAAIAAVVGVLAGCATADGEAPPDKTALPPDSQREGRLLAEIHRALDAKRVDDASPMLERLLFINPRSVEGHLAAARMHLLQGRHRLAIQSYEPLLDDPKVGARAHEGMGIAQLQSGDHEAARSHLATAVERDPGLWRAWNALGYLRDSARDWDDAEASYARALEARPDSAEVLNNRGFSRLLRGRYEDAIGDFRAALDAAPASKVARMNLRIALAWLGRYVEALAGVAPPDLPRVLNNVGYVAMLKGDYATAESYFSRAMEISPSYNTTAASNLRRLEEMKLGQRAGQ